MAQIKILKIAFRIGIGYKIVYMKKKLVKTLRYLWRQCAKGSSKKAYLNTEGVLKASSGTERLEGVSKDGNLWIRYSTEAWQGVRGRHSGDLSDGNKSLNIKTNIIISTQSNNWSTTVPDQSKENSLVQFLVPCEQRSTSTTHHSSRDRGGGPWRGAGHRSATNTENYEDQGQINASQQPKNNQRWKLEEQKLEINSWNETNPNTFPNYYPIWFQRKDFDSDIS